MVPAATVAPRRMVAPLTVFPGRVAHPLFHDDHHIYISGDSVVKVAVELPRKIPVPH